MAHVSVKRLFRPLLWLLWLVLLAIILPLALAAMTPIFLLVWIVGMVAVTVSAGCRQDLGMTPLGMAVWLPLWPLLLLSMAAPAVALAHAAAVWLDAQTPSLLPTYLDALLRLLPPHARELLADLNISRKNWGWFCVAAGVTGVSSNLVYAFLDIPWRLKQIRQVRSLPRSKARSAAIGLAEFEGTVRATTADGSVSKSITEPALPFHLEDESGRILVDPRGAKVRLRQASGQSLSLNEIEEGIRDGDHVYVIGNVQLRADAPPGALGPDALVVRPLEQSLVSSPVARLLFPKGDGVADRDAPNIFIVDRGAEHDVIARLRLTLWDFCAIGTVYVAASLWLVQAAWPWLSPTR